MNNSNASIAPRLARLDAIEEGARAFFDFASEVGVRFDLGEKVRASVAFSAERGGSTFALPTKLVGTSKFQPSLAALGAVPHTYRKLIVRRTTVAGVRRIALYFGGDCLGYVQDKHARWMLPLVSWGLFGLPEAAQGVEVYALAVTGGEPGRPTRGLNVVLTGIGQRAAFRLDALDAQIDRAAEEEAERFAAYPDEEPA